MTTEINGHQVEEHFESDSITFSCTRCDLESNFKISFRREVCSSK